MKLEGSTSAARAKAVLHYLRHQPATLPWFPRWARTLAPGGGALPAGLPWIPVNAIDWLDRHVTSAHRVFEYGSGGSTAFFAARAHRVVTVEHDRRWYARVFAALPRELRAKVDLCLVEAGAGGAPGYDERSFTSAVPADTGKDFEPYVRFIERFGPDAFDWVFVDGRARPSCLRVARASVRPGGSLVLDNSDIGRYRPALALMDGWDRQDFYGIAPEPIWKGRAYCNLTSVFRRPR